MKLYLLAFVMFAAAAYLWLTPPDVAPMELRAAREMSVEEYRGDAPAQMPGVRRDEAPSQESYDRLRDARRANPGAFEAYNQCRQECGLMPRAGDPDQIDAPGYIAEIEARRRSCCDRGVKCVWPGPR